MNDTYPVGLACTAIELHEYPTGVRIRPFTITPPEPSQIYTFFVYHQPFREPQLSFRDVRPARRHRGTCPAPTGDEPNSSSAHLGISRLAPHPRR